MIEVCVNLSFFQGDVNVRSSSKMKDNHTII